MKIVIKIFVVIFSAVFCSFAVADMIDGTPPSLFSTKLFLRAVPNIAAIRNNVLPFPSLYVNGYSTPNDGGEGNLQLVSTDLSSADNGCTIFVDKGGHRYYRSAANAGNTVNVKWCGARGDGTTEDAAAINSAANVACNGHATIANPTPWVGGWVFLPPGNYVVDGGVNLDNWSGGYISGGCGIQGSGSNSSVLLTKTGATANILEAIGFSNVIIKDLYIRASSGTTVTNAIAIALSTINSCNVVELQNVGADTFTNLNSILAIQGCSEGLLINTALSAYAPATSTHTLIQITSSNPYGWLANASSGAVVSTTYPQQTGGWTFVQTQIHDITQASGTSTVIPFYLQGTNSQVQWFGGVIGCSTVGSTGGCVTTAGNVTGLSFLGTNFYGDNGTQGAYTIYPNGTIQGLSMRNCAILNSSAVFAAITGITYSSLIFEGNTSFGAVFAPPSGNSGTVISSIIDAHGGAINLGAGGSITHSIMLQPGTVTAATNTSNGSF